MRIIETTASYKKSYRKANKRGWDMKKLDAIISDLQSDLPLPEARKDHALKEQGVRECHIAPDWLLVYSKLESPPRLRLIVTGSHADLF